MSASFTQSTSVAHSSGVAQSSGITGVPPRTGSSPVESKLGGEHAREHAREPSGEFDSADSTLGADGSVADASFSGFAAPTAETDRLPLSGFIICKNEQDNLGNCIESLARCAEMVIVDSGSTDGTIALVRRYMDAGWPIRFHQEPWRGYAAQKQFALDQCRESWCISLDADERLCDDLQARLPELMSAPQNVVGWRFQRRPYLIGYGYTPRNVKETRTLRLFRREFGRFDLAAKVHEGIVAEGDIGDARSGGLLHYRPLPLEQQILTENHYSTLKAEGLLQRGVKPRKWRLIFNPLVYFLRMYFLNRMYRCGFPGFIHAMTAAVYSFLTECKIYQKHAESVRPSRDDMDRPSGDRLDGSPRGRFVQGPA